jgi:EpsI family protein
MTTKRLAILLAVLLAGMSSIFLLPKQLGFQPVGIELKLPKMIGGWYGTDVAVSAKEKTVLGEGTEFARKSYRNGRGYEITASIVLSGQDMNTSIHRPERCLPAQGFTIIDKTSVAVPLPDRRPLQVTRLQNVRNLSDDAGTPTALYNVTYYWFVGHSDATGSHFERTWIDVKDRLVHGYNQRWAYLTVAAQLPPGAEQDPRIERVVDEWMQDFIKQLLPKIQKNSGSPQA